MNCPLRIKQTFSIWRGARFVDIMLVRWKPLGSKNGHLNDFTHYYSSEKIVCRTVLLSRHDVSRLLVHGMSYSQTLSNSFCTLTDVFLYCTLSDAFFYPIKFNSSRHHPAYRPVLCICLTHYIPLFIHWRMKIFSEIFNVKRRLTFR